MAWILLIGAIAAEVTATSALKQSAGFSRLVPTIVVVVGYLLSFTFLAFAIKQLQVSIAYAIWSGVGTAAIAVIGLLLYNEPFTPAKIVGLTFVIAGVITLSLASTH